MGCDRTHAWMSKTLHTGLLSFIVYSFAAIQSAVHVEDCIIHVIFESKHSMKEEI